MAEVKWIKLDNDIFNNRKIRQIEKMPDGDTIIVIWLKILTLAGHVNDGGYIYLTRDIPYTDQLLANEFDRPLTTIQMALEVFRSFGMLDITDNILHVSNWERYQNVEGLDKIREQTRERVANYRERQKLLQAESNATCNVTVTQGNVLDIDIDKEIDKEKEIKKEIRHKYGEYQHVLLSDADMAKLKEQFPDYERRIKTLDEYLENNPRKHYANHYLTIRNWARKDEAENPKAEDSEIFKKAVRRLNK